MTDGGTQQCYISLTFPQSGMVWPIDALKEAHLHHAEFEHETASLLLGVAVPDMTIFESGTPVIVTYGWPPLRLTSFFGYVNHPQPVVDTIKGSLGHHCWIHCVGTSYPFKNGGFYAARDASVVKPFVDLASAQRFLTNNVQDPLRLWPSLSQNGDSEWAFFKRLAKMSGYTLYTHGMSLYCHARSVAVAQSINPVPLYISHQNIKDWASSLGALSPAGGELASRQLSGIDPRTGSVYGLQNDNDQNEPILGQPKYSPVITKGYQYVTDSLGEAQQTLSAIEGEHELSVHAEMKIQGAPEVLVGTKAQVQGINAIDDGDWYVRSVEHIFQFPHFTSKIGLGRDALHSPAPTSTSTLALSAPLTPRLVGSQWVA